MVRAQAARALGECKDPQAVAPLIKALTDPQPDVRFWAAWALGAIKDPRSAAPLIAAFNDADAEVRYRVAEALGELKSRQAEDALSLALNDPGEAVRQVAAWALQQIRDHQAAVETGCITDEMAAAVTSKRDGRSPAAPHRPGASCRRGRRGSGSPGKTPHRGGPKPAPGGRSQPGSPGQGFGAIRGTEGEPGCTIPRGQSVRG